MICLFHIPDNLNDKLNSLLKFAQTISTNNEIETPIQ